MIKLRHSHKDTKMHCSYYLTIIITIVLRLLCGNYGVLQKSMYFVHSDSQTRSMYSMGFPSTFDELYYTTFIPNSKGRSRITINQN